jgi:hypothetical protein
LLDAEHMRWLAPFAATLLGFAACHPMTHEQHAGLFARDELACRWKDLRFRGATTPPFDRDEAWIIEGCGKRMVVTCSETVHKPRPGHDVPFVPDRISIDCYDECAILERALGPSTWSKNHPEVCDPPGT